MLNEISHSAKDKYFMKSSRVVEVIRTKKNGGFQALGKEEIGNYCFMGTALQLGKMKMF